MDVLVTVLNGQAKLLHNTTRDANHWLTLKLTGTKSNRMAIGAEIKVTASSGLFQDNNVTRATRYACSSDPRVHFGLGSSPSAKTIEIKWPSGKRQVLHDVKADRVVAITEEP
jgi:hypothetical protein